MFKKAISILSVLAVGLGFADNNVNYEKAIFAGGCFWCLESDFEYMQHNPKLSHNGIKEVVSGYDGGAAKKSELSISLSRYN